LTGAPFIGRRCSSRSHRKTARVAPAPTVGRDPPYADLRLIPTAIQPNR
jgi:hypothetical protein